MEQLISQFGIIRRIEELSREGRVMLGVLGDQDSIQIIIFETHEQKKIVGEIMIDKGPEGAYMVANAKAEKGLGKYLYYMAMKSIYPKYLASDICVSEDAQRVYKALDQLQWVQKDWYCVDGDISEEEKDFKVLKYRWDGTPYFGAVISHSEAVLNRAKFVALLYRRQKRLGQLMDKWRSMMPENKKRDRLTPLIVKTDKLIKASYEYGKKYLGLPLVVSDSTDGEAATKAQYEVVTHNGIRGKIYGDDIKKEGMVPVYPKIIGTRDYKKKPVYTNATKLTYKGRLN